MNTPPPPHTHTQNWNLARTCHLEYTTIHPQWKFGQDLALWVCTILQYPSPPSPTTPKIEIWPGFGTLSFHYSLILPSMEIWPRLGTFSLYYTIYPCPPPPPLEIEIWPGFGTLSFDYSSLPSPPSPLKFGLECVQTNRYIPHGYRLIDKSDSQPSVFFLGHSNRETNLLKPLDCKFVCTCIQICS